MQQNVTKGDRLARVERRLGRKLDDNERAWIEEAAPTEGLALRDQWGRAVTLRELLEGSPT
jgi:hypothetical protein